MADVRGTTASNTINSADGVTGGADEIYGRGGNDTVFGGGGDDQIFDGAWSGGPARTAYNFFLHGTSTWSSGGNDTFNGEGGNDRIVGDGGNDTLNGGSNNDTLQGGIGNDELNGDSGNDVLIDDAGADTINGGTGTDVMRFNITGSGDGEPTDSEPLEPIGVKGVFFDIEAGTAGFAFEDPADNRINSASWSSIEIYEARSGRSEEDEMRGDDTDDTFRGFEGNDTIEGRGGSDVINGSSGTDTASYESSDEGVSIDIRTTDITQLSDQADVFGDRLISIENLTGSAFNDVLRGGDGANLLRGLGNNDLLDGRGGADSLDGGSNIDTATYEISTAGVTISTNGSAGSGGFAAGDRLTSIENVIGSNHRDVISGSDNVANALKGLGGDDDLSGLSFNDNLAGGLGINFLDGGSGTDTADYQDINGPVSVSLLDFGSGGSASASGLSDTLISIENVNGSNFDDSILGSIGVNTLRGFDGNDTLSGFGGIDSLNGGEGDDVLAGGLDADTLSGSNGIDTASYRLAGSGVIVDLGLTTGLGGEALGDRYFNIERIIASDHDDKIIGNGFANKLSGLDGDDTLIGGAGADTLEGGDDLDTASYETSTIGITLNLVNPVANTGDAAGDSFVSIERFVGTDFNDTMIGNGSANIFAGGANADGIQGAGGADQLFGESGTDTLNGGDQNDQLFGGSANDTLIGGAGADAMDGSTGVDTASYETAAGPIVLDLGTPANNVGDAAGDTFTSVERFIGSAFKDEMRAGGSAVSFLGGDGTDLLVGSAAQDTLAGGGLDDTLTGGGAGDILFGDLGDDTASYDNAAAGVVIDLTNTANNAGDALGDIYISIELFVGSDFTDTLIGDGTSNTLAGSADNDTLIGGAGADTLDGGEDNDTASYENAAAGVTVDLVNAALNSGDAAGDSLVSIERLRGSALIDFLNGDASGNALEGGGEGDRLDGRAGGDTLEGGDGNDNLIGGAGGDDLNGGDGRDSSNYQASTGVVVSLDGTLTATGDAVGDIFASIETLIGSLTGKNRLRGDGGINIIQGGNNGDTLEGQGGVDTLRGLADVDILLGGLGADNMTGGTEGDIFVWTALNQGGDRVEDFVSAEDILRFRAVSLGAGFAAGTSLTADQLVFGTAATQAFGQFVYDASGADGRLFFDIDGTGAGAATLIANLTGTPTVALGDFDII